MDLVDILSRQSHSLGCDIASSSQDSSENLTIDLIRANLGHAEVWDFSSAVVVQENVAALEISVDNGWDSVLMKKLESASAVKCDAEPRPPV